MEYTYTETDLEKKIQQMKNNGCLPPMQLGEWELLNDGGIGHYYLCLRDYELTHLLHTHVLLGEDVDAAFLALCAIDRLRIITHTESEVAVQQQKLAWAEFMAEM